MKKYKSIAFIIMLLVVALVFAGCTSPKGSKELTAYELVKSAVEKNAALDSSEMNIEMNLKMSIMGMSMDVPTTYNVKCAKENGSAVSSAVMEMSVMGKSLTNKIYIEGDNIYIRMEDDDEPIKYRLSITDELAPSYNVSELTEEIIKTLPEDILKDIQIVNGENGVRTVTAEISEEKFNELFKEYTDRVLNDTVAELSENTDTELKVSNAKADITINKDGYITDYNLAFDMNMKLSIEGVEMDLAATCDSTCSYVDPGSKVTVEKPDDLEEYIDYRSVMN